MKIGIDVDGVLADFNRAFIDKIIEVTGEDKFPARPFDIPTWHYPQHYGYSDDTMAYPDGPIWGPISEDKMFWYRLYPYDGVVEFLKALDPSQHDFYFITNRPGATAKSQTENWLEFHSFGLDAEVFSFPTVLVSKHKGLCARALGLDLYIDDNTDNCLDVNHESPRTQTIMLARPWNATQSGILRVESLDQFAALIPTV